jgi:hypothetical protein
VRNIRHYDLRGDEYYNEPHLYCEFADNGEPYESRGYALLAKNYDWPLNPERQLKDIPGGGSSPA